MNILITGGAGFIGSNLAQFHIDKGDNVTVIDNFITGSRKNIDLLLDQNKVIFFNEDVLTFDFSKLGSMDIIYHLASPASPIQYKKYQIETMMVNSLGTQRVLEFMKNSKSKTFVISSTSETYGDPEVHPQIEEYWGHVNPIGVRSCYDEAKRFSEALTMSYFRTYNLNVRIARIFNTYGPHMEKEDGRVISNFIMQALTEEPITIYGDGTQTRSFCYVSDMVNGLYKMATAADIEGKVINIGNPDEKTILEVADIIKKYTNTKSEIVKKPIDADDPKKRRPDITKATTLLQWTPTVAFEEGIQKTINYFKTRFL